MEKLVLSSTIGRKVTKYLLESISIASAAKSSATYYHSRDEQINAIKLNIKELYGISKELPLIVACQEGVTGKFISEALLNEFKSTYLGGACNIINPIDWYDNKISDKAILTALNNLNENSGIPYVLRLFIDLKKNKINNERSRKIFLSFLLNQQNLEFYSVKYRNKIAEILKHIYGIKKTSILIDIAKKYVRNDGIFNDKELNMLNDNIFKYSRINNFVILKLLLFIFKDTVGVRFNEFETPIIFEYDKAKTDISNITKIPEEVLIGLISNPNHPQYNELWNTKTKRENTKALIRKNVKVTSVNQQIRQTKSSKKLGVNKNVDLDKATDYLALYKTGYENGWSDDILNAIDKLAEKNKFNDFMYKNIGVIVDKSKSMDGHSIESKNTPKAIADFTSKVLKKSTNKCEIVETDQFNSDLATSFVKLIRKNDDYDAIFVITDGYENSYDGLFNEIVSIYLEETNKNLPIFQISPITGAEMKGSVRILGDDIIGMGINNPKSIQPQIKSRLLEIDVSKWLENEFKMLAESNVSR